MSEKIFNAKQLDKLIIGGLRRHASIQATLVPLVIEKTGWDWERCERYIEQVESDNRFEISTWQGNAFMIAGFVFIGLGFGTILIAVEAYIGFDLLFRCIQAEFSTTSTTFKECLYTGVFAIRPLSEFGIIGITLILGGVAGIIFAKRQMNNYEVFRND